jgi:hypothetical protein
MEHLTALMILIGCSGPTTCHQLPAPLPAYGSVAECRHQLKRALMQAVKIEGEVHGTCADVGTAPFEQDASVVWNMSKDGRIAVRVIDGDAGMAADGSVVASR